MDFSNRTLSLPLSAWFACFFLALVMGLPSWALAAGKLEPPVTGEDPAGQLLIRDGQRLYADGEYERALSVFAHAARKFPQDSRPHMYRARILLKQGKPQESMEEAVLACKLDGRSAPAHFILGQNLLLQDEFEKAEEQLKLALAADPALPDCHYVLGRLYEMRGLNDKALEQYQQAARDDAHVKWALEAISEHLVIAKCQPMTVYSLEALGRMLAARGQDDGAIAVYKQTLALDSANGRVQLALGRLYAHASGHEQPAVYGAGTGVLTGKPTVISLDDPQLGIPFLREAAKLDPSDCRPLEELITIYGDNFDWYSANELAERWVEIQPDSVAARWHLALCKLFSGEFYEATSTLDEALKLDPDNFELHNLKALVSRELGKTREAGAEIEQALKLKPDYLPAICNKAMFQSFDGNTSAADEEFDQLALSYANVPTIVATSALLDAQSGKVEQAKQKVDNLLKSNRATDIALVALAIVQGREAKTKEEIDTLKLTQPGSENVLATTLLAQTLFQQQDYKAAADEAQQGLQQAPGNPQLKHILAMSLGKQGNWHGAAFLLKEALAKSPKDSEMRSDLGYALEMKAETEDAAVAYADALKLNPAAEAPRMGLARLAMESKRFSQAVKQTDEVLSHDPFNDEARLLRGEANYRMAKFEDSIRDCGVALQHNDGDKKANCLMGRSLYQVHRWSNALPYLWICIGKPDASAEEWFLTATAMSKVNDLSGAQSVAQTGLSNYPEYKPLLELLTELNKRTGDPTPVVRK